MRLEIILRKGLYNNREFPCVSFVISCRLVKHEPATRARQSTYWKPFCFQLTNRGKSRVGDSSGRLFWNVNCIINHFTILARLQLYFDTYKFQPHFSVFYMHIFSSNMINLHYFIFQPQIMIWFYLYIYTFFPLKRRWGTYLIRSVKIMEHIFVTRSRISTGGWQLEMLLRFSATKGITWECRCLCAQIIQGTSSPKDSELI